jgi:uncharacterized protein YceK
VKDYESAGQPLRRLLTVLLLALITIILTSGCASVPQQPLPADLAACRDEVTELRARLAECNDDAAACLEYLKDELSKQRD